MAWQFIRISRFGGPEVLELADEQTLPTPGPGEVRIKVLAAGTGFTERSSGAAAIRTSRGRCRSRRATICRHRRGDRPGCFHKPRRPMVADLCVVGATHNMRSAPRDFLVPVPAGVDPAEAVCIPLAYLTAYQMLIRYRRLPRGATIL